MSAVRRPPPGGRVVGKWKEVEVEVEAEVRIAWYTPQNHLHLPHHHWCQSQNNWNGLHAGRTPASLSTTLPAPTYRPARGRRSVGASDTC